MGDPVTVIDGKMSAIFVGVMVMAWYENGIAVDLLCHHIPRATCKADALTLTDGIEPKTFMFANRCSGLIFDQSAWLLTQMMSDEVTEADFSQKADTLAVFTLFIWQIEALGLFTYLRFIQVPNREYDFAELLLFEVWKKIGLVFDRIWRTCKVSNAVLIIHLCIMAWGDLIEFFVVAGKIVTKKAKLIFPMLLWPSTIHSGYQPWRPLLSYT